MQFGCSEIPTLDGAPQYVRAMQTPEHIVEQWREKAADNERLRRRHHDYQQWGYKHSGPYEECWDCQRAVAKCKSKVRHESIEAAWGHALEVWPEKKLVAYRCFWTEGLHWHVRTMRSSTDKRKLRRRVIRDLPTRT